MKRKNTFNTLMILLLGAFILVSVNIIVSVISDSRINPQKDYKVFVKSNVINTLNDEYSQDIEKWYCVSGIVNDEKKEITITNIVPVKLMTQTKGGATSVERYACSGKFIGQIHTHPKWFGLFPKCYFSETDIYTLGELYGKNGLRIGGVYCNKDKIAFYLSGSEYNSMIFDNNSRVDYTLIP